MKREVLEVVARVGSQFPLGVLKLSPGSPSPLSCDPGVEHSPFLGLGSVWVVLADSPVLP